MARTKNRPTRSPASSTASSLSSDGNKMSPPPSSSNHVPHGSYSIRRLKNQQESLRDLITDLLTRCTSLGSPTPQEAQHLVQSMDQVMSLQKDGIKMPERKGKFDHFLSFCEHHGVDTGSISITAIGNEDDFGLCTRKDMNPDDVILSIPRSIMITAEERTSSTTKSFSKFVQSDPLVKQMPNLLLVFNLIHEMTRLQSSSPSFYQPYLDILPSSYSTPLYWTWEQIVSMKPSPVQEEAFKLIKNIVRQYCYFWNQMNSKETTLASNLPFKQLFTFNLYRWAVSTVMTRQNLIPASNGIGQVNALIPLWDMCNHRMGKFSTDFSVESDSVICYAMDSFPSGSEIKIYYGNRSNGEFLIHNGFVPDANPHDFLAIKLGISKNDPLNHLKTSLCLKSNLPPSGTFKLFPKEVQSDRELMAFLRIFHMDQEQLTKLEDAKDLFKSNGFTEVDIKIRQFLSTRSFLLLSQYPKSLDAISHPDIRKLLQTEMSILKGYVSS